jgi:S1-C subfamily serine protease
MPSPADPPVDPTASRPPSVDDDPRAGDLQGFWLVMGAGLLGTVIGGVSVLAGSAIAPRHRAPLVVVQTEALASSATADPRIGRAAAAMEGTGAAAELTPLELTPPRGGGAQAGTLEDAVAITRSSVVNLRVGQTLSGAGVVFDASGLVFTNFHVVAAAVPRGGFARTANEGSDHRITARFANGRELAAEIVVADRTEDIAVLSLVPTQDGERFDAARLGESSRLRVGQEVFAVGSPLGLESTVATGIVSAIGRTGVLVNRELPVIQLDAAINLGNSGGPLFNLAGELVGITTARAKGGEGIGFAIPIDRVKAFLRALQDGHAARAGAVGLRMNAKLPVAVALEGTDYEVGIMIDQVFEGPAKRAGMKVGDAIVEVRGKRFDELDDSEEGRGILAMRVARNVRSLLPGESLDVTIVRDGQTYALLLEAEATSAERQIRIDVSAVFGLVLDDNTDELVIVNVDEGSRLAGVLRGQELKGWRIRRVLGRKVVNVDDLAQIIEHLRKWAGGGKAREVAVELEDPAGRRVFIPAFPLNEL